MLLPGLKYLTLLTVFVAYLQAAFEVNGEYIQNTWGDEYDLYVHNFSKADNCTHDVKKTAFDFFTFWSPYPDYLAPYPYNISHGFYQQQRYAGNEEQYILYKKLLI